MTENHNPLKDIEIRDCGQMQYRQALELQEQLWARRLADQIGHTILLVEHPPVITLGARQKDNRLLAEESWLLGRGIEVVPIRRGGAATAHNPGQVVCYPIVKLKDLGLTVTDFVCRLQQAGIAMLRMFGLQAEIRKGFPGIWVGERKIGSIGVQVRKWVTLHGMAINICNDLSIFQAIVPCGLDGVRMTSLENETGKAEDMQSIKKELGRILANGLRRPS
jgi:lipoate-protein ligase B